MRRGEGNDYTIDYTAPSITFTFHRPIHSGMQVLVEFEFSNKAYQRTLTGVDSVIRSSDDFLTVGVAGVREEDSRYNDMLGLTDADRLRLQRAGDASSGYYRQRKDGAGHLLYRFVGMGNGAYIRQYNPITKTMTIFMWVPARAIMHLTRSLSRRPTVAAWRICRSRWGDRY